MRPALLLVAGLTGVLAAGAAGAQDQPPTLELPVGARVAGEGKLGAEEGRFWTGPPATSRTVLYMSTISRRWRLIPA